jgi:hypothetical protein
VTHAIRRLAAAALAATGLALAALVTGGAARAASTHRPTLEVTIIQATRADAGPSIDPRLKDLPQLTQREPFVRYNVYQLLDRQGFPLDSTKPVKLLLPNGRSLKASLVAVSSAGDGGSRETRYQLDTQIVDPADSGSAAFLRSLQVTASANEPFFIGGQSYQGGTMFIELNVRP